MKDAKFTDIIEIKAFIGILYLAGHLKSTRQNLEELWGKDGFGVDMVHLVMSIKRFVFILKCLRFDDREARVKNNEKDKLAPIREIFEKMVHNCRSSYSLGQNCTIDEKLEGFRGRCSFKQYIPSKPNKYGIKIYALVDARTLFTCNMEIYAGKNENEALALSNMPGDVVKRLVEPIYNSGCNITADNWFTDFDTVISKDQKTVKCRNC